MTSLENIPRISPPTRRGFLEDYVRAQTPVIIDGLFAGQPLAAVNTRSKAMSVMADVQIGVRQEYFRSWLRSGSYHESVQRRMTYRDYFRMLRKTPDTTSMCTEFRVPREVVRLFEVPSLCGIRPDGDVEAFMFIGNAGNFAHCHFDGDQRTVLHYQVWGRKRLVLIPPRAAKMLNPILNFSTLMIENMTDAERRAFLAYVGGYECIMHPGDTVHMPALWWHHLDYVEDSMSFNLRFGCPTHNKFLRQLHTHFHVQNVSAELHKMDRLSGKQARIHRRIVEAFERTYLSPQEKYARMAFVVARAYEELCEGGPERLHWLPHQERLDAMLAARPPYET